MNIKIQEFKKLICSPVIIGLTVVFILFNIFSMSATSYLKEDLKIINNIISEFGYEINDEIISKGNVMLINILVSPFWISSFINFLFTPYTPASITKNKDTTLAITSFTSTKPPPSTTNLIITYLRL